MTDKKKDQESSFHDDDTDRHCPDGLFITPAPKNTPRLRMASLLEYCRVKGIEPHQIAEEDLKQFLLPLPAAKEASFKNSTITIQTAHK